MEVNKISCDIVKTDISAVKIFEHFILIGNGYYLYVYCKKNSLFKKKLYIFDEHIFGISVNKNKKKILILGGKYLKVYDILDCSSFDLKEIKSYVHLDWILTAKFINDADYITAVTMHNVVILWDSTLEIIESKECEERCISYCAHLVNENWSDLIVLVGTVFSQILLWWPQKSLDKLCPVIHRLIGHKGVIFSIDYHPKSNVICTTSDDRTAKIWAIKCASLTEELSQECISIDLKQTLVGHSARVFKCKVLRDRVITAGEEGIVNIWDTEGKLIREVEVHQAGPVWSLDVCEETNEIVTGGGDSGVFLFKLNSAPSRKQLKTYVHENPRNLLLVSKDSLLYLTDDGMLIYYKIKHEIFTAICVHEDLKSYGLMEKSPCGSLIALAGYHGGLHLYRPVPGWLEYLYSCQITTRERLYSMHWLSCSVLVTCGAGGVLTVWIVSVKEMFPIHFWQLPYSKERWSTAACFCGTRNALVGDRRGALYLYTFDSSRPVQIIKKAHNYLGISNLHFHDGRIVSLGRNSTMNEYRLDEKSNVLIEISSHKVPFSWLAGLYRIPTTSHHFLFGFSGAKAIVYDPVTRRTLLESDCGGGHRSWDLHTTTERLTFAHIKDKRVNVIEYDLAGIRGESVIEGYHLNETNSLRIVAIDHYSNRCFFVSGGEDTVIRLCSSNVDESDFRTLNALKSHLSSIRTIAVIKSVENRYLIFSGGGRAQIIMWQVEILKDTFKNCCEKFSISDNSSDFETRVMDLSTIQLQDSVYLFAAYSDGHVKIYKVNSEENQRMHLTRINQISLYHSRCILRISILPIDDGYCVLVTMATDGSIIFWNVTDTFTEELSNERDDLMITSVNVHQSGINSFAYRLHRVNCYVFLTGGDDTAISLNAFDVSPLRIERSASYSDQSCHGAQVTGAYIMEDRFLTASVDQKVLLFEWKLIGDVFSVHRLCEYNSGICDIQGMECALSERCLKIFLYGRGCELLTVKL